MSATPLADRVRAKRPTRQSFWDRTPDGEADRSAPVVVSPTGRSWFCPCSASVAIDFGTCPFCGYRRADFQAPATTVVKASSLIKLPDGKRFDVLRDLIPSAERYVSAVERSSTPGEYRARIGSATEAIAKIDAEVATLERKLGDGWDFLDDPATELDPDEREETVDRLTDWLGGYERTKTYLDIAGQRLAAVTGRYGR